MSKEWIQGYARQQVFPAALKPEQVSLYDIPRALSRRARFSGFTDGEHGYSVAQHCVIGSRLIAPPFALAFLLHEVSEVYLPDIPKPLKGSVRVVLPGCTEATVSWEHLEAQHADAVFAALNLSSIRPLIDSPEVKEMDLQMLALEKRDLMGPEPAPWGLPLEPPSNFAGTLSTWEATRADNEWIGCFKELTGRPWH